MTTFPRTWSDRASDAIGKLAAQPWSLLFVLLALNALARPYTGITHDARLYSVQVLNQIDPSFYGDDLFFRYGSQDQFSVFSRFAAPFVALLGALPAFFLLYMVFNSLIILGLKRLVEALIEDRLVSTLALAFMMVVPLNFGGLRTFHILEPFVTSRQMAIAFSLFGLERTLRGSYLAALMFLTAALLFHPLMAVGGLLVWGCCWAWNRLSGRTLVALTALVSLAGVLVVATPTLATRILGTMDEPWRDVILRATSFNFVSEWTETDWLNVCAGLLAVGAAACFFSQSRVTHGRFLVMITLVSVAAVVGTWVAENLPYALLLQGQPYRALWLLEVLQIPCAFWFVARLWSVPKWYGAAGAVIILGLLGLTTDLTIEWCFPLTLLPLLLLHYRGLDRVPHVPDWWRRSLVTSLILGYVGWAIYKWVILLANHAATLQRMDVLELSRLLLVNIGPIPWLLLFSLFVGWTAHRWAFGRRFQGAVLAAVILVQGAMAMLLEWPPFRENYTRHGQDIRFVQQFLCERHVPATPTIYSCLGQLDLVWLDLHAKCYFDWWQMGNAIYQRAMAMEGYRRAMVVGPFELDRFRAVGVDELCHDQARRFFELDLDTVHPDLGSLKKLCDEDGIDFLVLTHEFPGYVTAGNGRIFVYDCRQVRAALRLSLSPSPPYSGERDGVRGLGTCTVRPLTPQPLSPECRGEGSIISLSSTSEETSP